MSISALITGAFAVFALCAAAFNLWLYWLRPRESAHLWLAVSALGMMWLGAGMAAMQQASTLAEAMRAQLVTVSGALPVVIGFLRFSSIFVGLRFAWLEWTCGAYALVAVLALNLDPQLFFTGETRVAAGLFGERHIEAGLAPPFLSLMPGFAGMFIAVLLIYVKGRAKLESRRLLLGSIVVFTLCGLNDAATGAGVYQAPMLVPLGFGVFALGFTGMLVNRFVSAMERVELSASELHQVVEERTRALREKELELTHGARMATVGVLASGLAHEINNPVAFVTSNLRHLAESWRQSDVSSFDEVIGDTREGVDRIRRVVADLLRISRRGADDEVAVDLVRVIEGVLPVVQHEARWRARVTRALTPVPAVLGSEPMLSQIVLNLLVSALRSIPEGKPEENQVSIATYFEDGSVWLRVHDSGPPFRPDELANCGQALFDPLGEASFGLAVTQQLVSRHRGRIDIRSDAGGNRFLVELPPAPVGEAA